MKKQDIFKYKFESFDNEYNFYVNNTNKLAYEGILFDDSHSKILIGPKKAGKTFLSNLWKIKNKALIYNNNMKEILFNKKNVLIEDIDLSLNQENTFHIINHCKNLNLKILITSGMNVNEINISLPDLSSRLKLFKQLIIKQPDDDMLLNILTKLFTEKQFIINSTEIFDYILNRANRSYDNIIKIVNDIDKLSLEKKRQLTIPLIKEIL